MTADAAIAQERAEQLWRAIDMLPEKLRLVIVLAGIQGHDIREVALLLDVPDGTVKSRLFLARKQLRERLSKKLVVIALAGMVWVSSAGTTAAQLPEAGAKVPQNVPLEVQVVVSRYQGEKRISSLPYVLSLKSGVGTTFRQPGQGAQLRLGSRVPIPTQVFAPPADGKPATTTNSVSYENVGTNIDCAATALDGGRFEVTLTISETSVVSDPQDLKAIPGSGVYPVFRSYQSTNTLFVKDGQTTQFTAASDRVSGEVVRVEVKLTVVK